MGREDQKTGAGSSANGSRFAYKAFGIIGPEEKQDNNFSGHVRLRLIKREEAAGKSSGEGEAPRGTGAAAKGSVPAKGKTGTTVRAAARPQLLEPARPARPDVRTSIQPGAKARPARGAAPATKRTAATPAPGPRQAPSKKTAQGPSAPARLIRIDGPGTETRTAATRPVAPQKAAARPVSAPRKAAPRLSGQELRGRAEAGARVEAGTQEVKEVRTEAVKEAAKAAPTETRKPLGVIPSPAARGGGAKAARDSAPAAAAAPEKARKAEPAKDEMPAPMAEGPACDLYAPPKFSVATLIAYTLLAAALILGWAYRGEEILTAKEGAGYIIGIVGGSMMLLLVLYPLRKTARFMRRMGPIKHWFRAHMVLGLIGPALILFHANFSMGSLNSSVALMTMILVAVSGLIGRYIYAGIHYGLYGREMDLNELRNAFKDRRHGMKYVLDYAPAIQERILNFDARVLRPRYTFMGSLGGLAATSLAALWLRLVIALALRRTLRVAAKRHRWTREELKAHGRGARRYISNHIAAAMVIARFKVYERLFSLWHLLHLPLFLLLVLTAIIHVVAVHMF
jgi:hypothetical protein